MKDETIGRIGDYLKTFDINVIPNDQGDVDFIEKSLHWNIDPDYKQFILMFGGCYIGLPVYGVRNCSLLEDVSVVELTNEFKIDCDSIADGCCVISMDGGGNPIFFNLSGSISIYDHNLGREDGFAKNFEDMILSAIG
ncbi:SMI1/KNR4 family protein [Diaphorobacter sp. NR2-3-3-1]|nr:SMI1/KNR4 family protein [Diaphorobacter caeni]